MAKAKKTVVERPPVCTLTAAELLMIDLELSAIQSALNSLRNVIRGAQVVSTPAAPAVELPPLPVPDMPDIPGTI